MTLQPAGLRLGNEGTKLEEIKKWQLLALFCLALRIYPGEAHGLFLTAKARLNQDLLAFITG